MATTATPVRFSTANVNNSAPAQNFPWEKGVPVNPFWDTIDWVSSTQFLYNFSDSERAELPIDPNSTASPDDKVKFLISLLDAKLAREEESAAASSSPNSLAETKPKVWRNLIFAKHVLQSKLGLVSEAGKSIRALAERFGEKDEVLQQALANQLVAEGDYVQAEKIMGPIVGVLDADLTKASPQAIGARRALLSAVWKQGVERRADAEKVVADIKESIQGMVGTKYEVYVGSEGEELERLLAELKG